MIILEGEADVSSTNEESNFEANKKTDEMTGILRAVAYMMWSEIVLFCLVCFCVMKGEGTNNTTDDTVSAAVIVAQTLQEFTQWNMRHTEHSAGWPLTSGLIQLA